ncbi:Hpt domain-containing protein [Rhizobiales bacterium]|uniref:Hpt domain-containing protein n=1 Tax=Hongsoonwoonella zoysiae TaxID=2821844 RepID=UPI00156072F3|nr:Hpt domain-containing protein [Hongsoonwoonella zoysiae]NRG18160.1 Hpt domain-containing protein [Hongsoonwoonella zoysiae]
MAGDNANETPDYEVVKPPRDLRAKVRVLDEREAARFDPVKAAEEALESLSAEFDRWMGDEVQTLFDAWAKAAARTTITADAGDELFRASHDIKGQASTLGFPLVGAIAGNLCYLLESVKPVQDVPKTLLQQHVDAIRAMVAERATDENRTAKALVERLADVTDDFIAQRSS